MASSLYTMYDHFSHKGYWWLPDKPEEKVYGELCFSDDSISLELIGSFDKSSILPAMEPSHQEIILGHSTEGKKITLSNSVLIGGKTHIPGMATSVFSPAFVFVNEHFQSSDELRFSSILINTFFMEEWMGLDNPFNVGYLNTKEGSLQEYRAKYEPIAEIEGRIEALGSRFQTRYDFSTSQDPYRHLEFNLAAFFKVLPDETKPLKWFLNVARDFCNLLSLMTDEPIFVRRVSLGLEQEREGEDKESGPTVVQLFYRQRGKPKKDSMHPGDMLVTLPAISKRPEEVFESWFQSTIENKALYDLYFSAVYNPEMYLDFELLCYIQGLESYCSATMGRKYLADEEYQDIYAAIVSSIPENAPKDFRQSIEQRAKYLNEYSQRKRLKEVLGSLGHGLESVFGHNSAAFIDSVVSTRNFLIHHDPGDGEKALRGEELYEANQRLRTLIIAILLKTVGIDDENVASAISQNRKYGRLLKE